MCIIMGSMGGGARKGSCGDYNGRGEGLTCSLVNRV